MTNMATPYFKDGRTYPTPAQLAAAVDDLAEELSRGFELAEASDRMGVSVGTGCVLFRMMCDGLGEQAC